VHPFFTVPLTAGDPTRLASVQAVPRLRLVPWFTDTLLLWIRESLFPCHLDPTATTNPEFGATRDRPSNFIEQLRLSLANTLDKPTILSA